MEYSLETHLRKVMIGLVLALIVAITLVAVYGLFMEKEKRIPPPIRNMTWNNVKLDDCWKL